MPPLDGYPIGSWHTWFAWFPVFPMDGGLTWLKKVEYRHCAYYNWNEGMTNNIYVQYRRITVNGRRRQVL